MSSDWRTVSFAEAPFSIIDGDRGTNYPKQHEFSNDGHCLFLNAGNVTPDGFSFADCAFISKEKDGLLRKGKLSRHDLVLTTRGTVGNVAYYSPQVPFPDVRINSGMVILRPDTSKVLPRYLFLFLRSVFFKDQVLSLRSGSAQPQLPIRDMTRIEMPLPNVEIQTELVEILGSLDDRITLLRETNATLEAIAQALFKSWFVDFDPVRAKQEGRAPEGMDEATAALFPDSFDESELGLVPKGWRVVTFGELCAVTIGGLWGKDTKEDTDLVPAISLRGVDLENLRSTGFAIDAPVRWVKPAAMEKRRVSENEVLIASSGAGPCGRPLWAGAGFESIYGMPVIFSNFVKRFDCGNPATAIYVDRLLAEMRDSREIWNYINGTSIPNLDDKLLLATKKVIVPSDDALVAFEQLARAIYRRLYSQQAQTLATLRDTLLPRLISGQLRLPEAEAMVEAAV